MSPNPTERLLKCPHVQALSCSGGGIRTPIPDARLPVRRGGPTVDRLAKKGRCRGAWASSRVSTASAAAVGPPAAPKAAATRRAPSARSIASCTLTRRRSGLSRRADSRAPAPATSTRRATLSRSRPNGTAHTGTPRASAFWVAPMPPCVTAKAARSSDGTVGHESRQVGVGRSPEGLRPPGPSQSSP